MDFWGKNQTIDDSLKKLYNDEFLSDIKFTFTENNEEKVIFAHSWILSMRSSIFYEKFKNSLGIQKIIPISDSREIFNEFLRFLYTDQCDLTDENSIELYNLSQAYDVNLLQSNITCYINNKLSPDSILKLYETCKFAGDCDPLQTKCHEMIIDNFTAISKHDSFLNIKHETLKNILKLNLVSMENAIFSAVIQWSEKQCTLNALELNGKNKRKMLSNLIYLIKFPTMSSEDFGNCVKDHPEVLNDNEILRIFKYISGIDTANMEFSCNSRFTNKKEKDLLIYRRDFQKYDQEIVLFKINFSGGESVSYNKNTTILSSSKRFALLEIHFKYIFGTDTTIFVENSIKNDRQLIEDIEINNGCFKFNIPFIIEPQVKYTITSQYKIPPRISANTYQYSSIIKHLNDLVLTIDRNDVIHSIKIQYH